MSYRVVQKGFMFIPTARTVLFLLSMTLFISACLPARIPVGVNDTNGTVVSTLSSNISLSYATPEKNFSGSGFLMFKKPDQMRVVILSPFGSVLQEVYISGDLVTIVDTGNGIAFRGTYNDLPDKGEFSSWRYIHWLFDIDPPDPLRSNTDIKRINRFGQREKAVFENGLLISKTTASGGHVGYATYTAVQGVALPLEIKFETAAKEKITILLEDPEINAPIADGAFAPNLNKLRVYPLSSLK
jgi:outer membrane lipoprotein-sorting protein